MIDKYKLFKFKLDKKNDIIEVGGGEGELSKSLIKLGYKVVLFIEPDVKKYKNLVTSQILKEISILHNYCTLN